MKYHKLNDLRISEIIFGGASLSGEGGGYGFGPLEDHEANHLVLKAIENGINTFDTAPIYGFNESERRLSNAIKNKREDVHIISKSGVSWHSNKRVNMSNDPQIVQKMLFESLKKFHYLDIYMIHWPDSKIDIRYPMEVLAKALDKKDIHHIGLCNTTNGDLEKANEVAPITCVQSEVNLFHNSFESLKFDGFKMGWGTFDKGILTGSVTLDRTFDKTDCRSWAPWWKKSNWKNKVKKVEKLSEFAKEHNHSLLEFALAYPLKYINVQSSLCGIKTDSQMQQVLSALENLPNEDLLKQARKMCE